MGQAAAGVVGQVVVVPLSLAGQVAVGQVVVPLSLVGRVVVRKDSTVVGQLVVAVGMEEAAVVVAVGAATRRRRQQQQQREEAGMAARHSSSSRVVVDTAGHLLWAAVGATVVAVGVAVRHSSRMAVTGA